MKRKRRKRESRNTNEKLRPLITRLDAIIQLLLEQNKKIYGKDFKESKVARLFNSVGLTPTEIAKILGKKSRTDVAHYLYSKKKSKRGQ